MKKTLLMALVALGSATHAFAEKTVLVNGSKTDKDVAELTFAGDNLSLKYSDGNTFALDMETVEIDFSDSEGVENTTNNFLSFNSVVEGELKLSGIEAGTALQIIATDGKIVYTGTTTGEETSINTSNLIAAPYLLKVGNQTIKFIKK